MLFEEKFALLSEVPILSQGLSEPGGQGGQEGHVSTRFLADQLTPYVSRALKYKE